MPNPVEPPPARGGRIGRLGGIAALSIGTVLAALYLFRQDLAGYAIRDFLSEAGLTSAALRVEEADLSRLVLTDIGAGPQSGVAIRRLSLAYRPAGLLERRIERVDLEGLALGVRADANGLSLGALDALPKGRSDGGGDWRIGALGLTEARIAVEGEVRATVTLEGEVVTVGEDRYRGELRLQGAAGLGDVDPADLDGTLSFSASTRAVEEADLALKLRRLFLPHLGAGDLDVAAHLKGGEARAGGRLQTPRGKIAFDLSGALPGDGDWGSARGGGTLEADLTEVALGEGDLRVSLNGRAEARFDGDTLALKALGPMELAAATPIGPLSVELVPSGAPTLSLEREQGRVRSLGVRIGEARVRVAGHGYGYGVREANAALAFDPVPALELRSLSLTETGPAPLIPPLGLKGEAKLEPAGLAFSAELTAAGGKARADLKGRWDRETGTGAADIEIQRLRFAPGGLQPVDLAPAMSFPLSTVTGGLSAQGSLGWQGGRIDANLEVGLEDLSLTLHNTRVQGIDGRVRFTGLAPPSTAPGQLIRIARIDAGVPLTQAEMRFQLDARRQLRIEGAEVSLLGGRVSQSKAVFDTAKQSYRGTLEVTGISLQSILDLAELEGAAATGEVGGRIPVRYEGGELTVTDATLATEAPGVLRYTPASAPAALQGQGAGMELALEALKDFRYEALSLALDGGSGRGWSSRVYLVGKNPELMEGHPFQFNINLSGDLDRVILSGLLGMTLADRIEERLKQR